MMEISRVILIVGGGPVEMMVRMLFDRATLKAPCAGLRALNLHMSAGD